MDEQCHIYAFGHNVCTGDQLGPGASGGGLEKLAVLLAMSEGNFVRARTGHPLTIGSANARTSCAASCASCSASEKTVRDKASGRSAIFSTRRTRRLAGYQRMQSRVKMSAYLEERPVNERGVYGRLRCGHARAVQRCEEYRPRRGPCE